MTEQSREHATRSQDSHASSGRSLGTTHQKTRFNHPEEPSLKIMASNQRFVNHCETVAGGNGLLQQDAPLQAALLNRSEGTLVDWQHAMQLCLHAHRESAALHVTQRLQVASCHSRYSTDPDVGHGLHLCQQQGISSAGAMLA